MTRTPTVLGLLATVLATSACISGQIVRETTDRRDALWWLKHIRTDLKNSYYDKNLRGVNIDSLYIETEKQIKATQSFQERYRALSRFLRAFNDSHTYYLGGTPVELGDFGLSYRFYGSRPFVTVVNDFSPAYEAGLRRGDEILTFDGDTLTRQNESHLVIDFIGQHPISTLQLNVRAPDRSVSSIAITADTASLYKMSGKQYRQLYATALDSARKATSHMTSIAGEKVFVWRPPEFDRADIGLGKVARKANEYGVVIVDMRGNRGGPLDHLEEVLAYFIAEPIEIGTLHMRWKKERFHAKPSGDRIKGKVFVLVDSETASAAEVFACLLQARGWATIVGDWTAGKVMASMLFGAASITVSDFVLPNGEHLENVGVKPDIQVLATPQEIATGEDPVLAHVLNLNGIPITPKRAATINATK